MFGSDLVFQHPVRRSFCVGWPSEVAYKNLFFSDQDVNVPKAPFTPWRPSLRPGDKTVIGPTSINCRTSDRQSKPADNVENEAWKIPRKLWSKFDWLSLSRKGFELHSNVWLIRFLPMPINGAGENWFSLERPLLFLPIGEMSYCRKINDWGTVLKKSTWCQS